MIRISRARGLFTGFSCHLVLAFTLILMLAAPALAQTSGGTLDADTCRLDYPSGRATDRG